MPPLGFRGYAAPPRRRRRRKRPSRFIPEGAYTPQTRSKTQPRRIPKYLGLYGRRRYPVLPKRGPYATNRGYRNV